MIIGGDINVIKSHMMSSNDSFKDSETKRRERGSSKKKTTYVEDFWYRHFEGKDSVSWKTFRAAFLEDYNCLIQEFAPRRVNWILTIIHNDIFASADDIHKLYYDKFCGKDDHPQPDHLWRKIKEYASERVFREGVIESMLESKKQP